MTSPDTVRTSCRPQPPAAFLTVKEVAAYLGISVPSVWRMTKRGALPQPVKLGTCTRWRRTEIEAAFAEGA